MKLGDIFLGFVIGLIVGIFWQYHAYKPYLANMETCREYIMTDKYLDSELQDICMERWKQRMPEVKGDVKIIGFRDGVYKVRKIK